MERKPSMQQSRPTREPYDSRIVVLSRCQRCKKPISQDEQEVFFLRTGLCYWCAYVDSQG